MVYYVCTEISIYMYMYLHTIPSHTHIIHNCLCVDRGILLVWSQQGKESIPINVVSVLRDNMYWRECYM